MVQIKLAKNLHNLKHYPPIHSVRELPCLPGLGKANFHIFQTMKAADSPGRRANDSSKKIADKNPCHLGRSNHLKIIKITRKLLCRQSSYWPKGSPRSFGKKRCVHIGTADTRTDRINRSAQKKRRAL